MPRRRAVEAHTEVEDSDFQGQTRGSVDIPEKENEPREDIDPSDQVLMHYEKFSRPAGQPLLRVVAFRSGLNCVILKLYKELEESVCVFVHFMEVSVEVPALKRTCYFMWASSPQLLPLYNLSERMTYNQLKLRGQ